MTGDFNELVKQFGLPVALLAAFIFGLFMEWWVMGKSAKREVDAANNRAEIYKAQLDKEFAMREKADRSCERAWQAVLELKGVSSKALDLVKQMKDAV